MKHKYSFLIFIIFIVLIIIILITLIFASNSDENNKIYLTQNKLVFDSLIYDEVELQEINKIELI